MLKHKNALQQEDGFTLIEILVVIAVIGVLAAIAIPVFLNQRQQANEATVKSDLKNAGTLIEGQGKFTGVMPADFVASKNVAIRATRTSDRANQLANAKFVDGSAESWGVYKNQAIINLTDQVFTNPSDGYKGMNYRRLTVTNSVSNGTAGQNTRMALDTPGKKSDVYTVGAAMRHNYTGCRTIHLEFKNQAGGWPGGIASQQFCFEKDQWKYFESTGTMTGDGSDFVFLSMFGAMPTANQNFDTTGATMVKGSKINSEAALDDRGNDFCVQAFHSSNPERIWNYSSLDGGIREGAC